jgi:hypothetical protein
MPLIAIGIAAVASFTAVSAAIAGTVTALEVVAAVGATIGAVGAVTKDKALTLAGTVIGAVGAIGSLAAGAGLLGDSASAPLFGTPVAPAAADQAAAGAVDTMSGAGGTATGDTSGLINADTTPGTPLPPQPPGNVGAVGPDGNVITAPAAGASDQLSPSLFATTAEKVSPSASGLDTSQLNDASLRAAQQGTAPLPTGDPTAVTATPLPPPAPGPTGPGTSAAPAPAPLASSPGMASSGVGSATPFDTSSSGFGGVISKIVDYAGDHPVVALGALQAGSSLLSGAFSTLTPAQVGAYNAQAAANDAAAALTKQQTQNLQMPKAVASSAPVTGSAQLVPIAAQPTAGPPAAPAPAGFINQAPVPSAPVTGVAA